MITEFLINITYGLFQFIFSVFPDIPLLNPTISSGADIIFATMDSVTGLAVYFIGTPLYFAGVSIILFWMLFDVLVKVFVRIVLFIILRRVIGG